MEIVGYEKSRVVRLVQPFRQQGAPVVTEAFAKLIARYGFARYPTLDDLKKEGPSTFETGKFQDVQIDEFVIYADGYSATGRCNTTLLDEFLNDVANWAAQEFGITFVLSHRNEVHYETMINVASTVDLAAVINPAVAQPTTEGLAKVTGLPFRASGFVFDCDPTDVNKSEIRRKPWRLFVERKLGFPFKENVFICQAPFSTPDLLSMLSALEQAVADRGN
jgi:hypothetical protein